MSQSYILFIKEVSGPYFGTLDLCLGKWTLKMGLAWDKYHSRKERKKAASEISLEIQFIFFFLPPEICTASLAFFAVHLTSVQNRAMYTKAMTFKMDL